MLVQMMDKLSITQNSLITSSSDDLLLTLQVKVVICHGSHGYIRGKKSFSWGKIFEGTYALVLEYTQIYPK